MYVKKWGNNNLKSFTLFGKSLLRIKSLRESIMEGVNKNGLKNNHSIVTLLEERRVA